MHYVNSFLRIFQEIYKKRRAPKGPHIIPRRTTLARYPSQRSRPQSDHGPPGTDAAPCPYPVPDHRQRHPVTAAPRPLYRAQPVLCSGAEPVIPLKTHQARRKLQLTARLSLSQKPCSGCAAHGAKQVKNFFRRQVGESPRGQV